MSEIKEMKDPTLQIGDTVNMQYAPKYNYGWISVKDRLPSYKQVVLVYLDTETITEAVYRGEYAKDDHIFRLELTHEDTGERVTHWMSLPEPPKDE